MEMEARQKRGLAIAATCKIVQKHGQWVVPSQTGNGAYRVNLNPISPAVPLCTCPDFEERGEPCKHVYAVQFVISRETMPDGSQTVTESVTLTKTTCAPRKTYAQNWPAYTAAQKQEKPRVQALLFDLCQGIDDPPQEIGRPRLSLRDIAFAAAFKVYCGVSGRRHAGDMQDAHAKGYLSRPVHYNSLAKYMEMEALAPILRSLIAESALPLKSVEVDFAVDSSGFSTSRFVRWFDHKYGQPKQEYDWVKCHLMTGVTTNIVTAVEIGERYAGDCPQFKPMLATTAKNFGIREVSADSAYLSYDNCDAVAALGGTPYIAFKSNTAASRGGTMAKMFHLYNLNREEYLSHYHKRSNVETTFSMIKAKFGDHLRSKMDAAMVNEALCKVLCHNLCCLIQSHYELGNNSTFWGKDAEPVDAAPALATMGGESVDDTFAAYAWI